ncbi:hypothetical protein [Lacticaseibacillus sharpeae]|uniref:Uncharacterized protein n=1 Tax=Lacticaseibacillus sharpeae JCM 1186 = DSM 20505 TaxID=1291052 RepID=A0A0R1ZIH5_9LACO|nr:hypothetical protein [Lacticaseibacillus sharpeae]KRM54800.1 hypothetical protein FC18_GL002217 [Lacticaseibacillus sharpeae JCM 1186 = DSM 20505]
MLIKLDSGDYINTEAVEVIKGGDNPYIGLRSNNSFDITPADRDRIVEAMGEKPSGEYGEVIRWNIAGNPYEIDLDGKTYTLTEVER